MVSRSFNCVQKYYTFIKSIFKNKNKAESWKDDSVVKAFATLPEDQNLIPAPISGGPQHPEFQHQGTQWPSGLHVLLQTCSIHSHRNTFKHK